MKCPRCKKEFYPETTSIAEWVDRQTALDNLQLGYIVLNYGIPICEGCLSDFRSGFYTCACNPKYIKNQAGI